MNPIAGSVNFSRQVDKVTLFNSLGRLIKEVEHENHLDLNEMVPGLYVILLVEGNQRSVNQVVKN